MNSYIRRAFHPIEDALCDAFLLDLFKGATCNISLGERSLVC